VAPPWNLPNNAVLALCPEYHDMAVSSSYPSTHPFTHTLFMLTISY